MKKIIIKILEAFSRVRMRFTLLSVYRNDVKYNLRNLRGTCKDSKDKSDADIMLVMHALEKGMSFQGVKREFGKEKALSLVSLLDHHIDRYGVDNQVKVATSILSSYLQDSNSVRDENTRGIISNYLETHSNLIDERLGGSKVVVEPNFNFTFNDLQDFYKQRSSVRSFSEIPLSLDEIQRAIGIAQLTPSACNRQASRVYVIRDREKIRRILAAQLGDQGWCNNADTLFIVSTIATYFGNLYERQQPYIDGGMFAMNLVMGLHAQKIATCYKMYVRLPKLDREIRGIVSMPENEVPIVLVLAGHYPDMPVESPLSHRNTIYYDIQ